MHRRDFSVLAPRPSSPEERNVFRVTGFSVALVGLFFLLMGRLWLLQIVRGETYRSFAEEHRSRTVRTVAPRGAVVDAKGRVIVANRAQFSVFLHLDALPQSKKKPKAKQKGELAPPDPVTETYLDRVAKLVEVSRAELDETIAAKRGRPTDPVPIRENINRHLMARLYERQDSLQGISIEVVPVRTYPMKSRAAHVLGYTAAITRDDFEKNDALKAYPDQKKYRPGDVIGRTGIEKTYDLLLRGTSGSESFEVDARGRRRNDVAREVAEAGATLHLTLDETVQEAAEKALAGRSGAVVAVDPRDGRVLALVSAPSYDLTWRTHPFTKAELDQFIAPGEMNRALRAFPPGSIYKIITSAAGIGEGKIGEGTSYSCAGSLLIGVSHRQRCHGTHGSVGLTDALAVSCDVFFYRVGMNLGADKMADWSRRFGLDDATGIDLPDEMGGIIPDTQWKASWSKKVNEKRGWHESPQWFPGDSANMAIGQGFVTVTPLQMALVSSAIANGGTIYEPRVVLKATAADNPKNVLYQLKPTVHSELKLTPAQLVRIQRGMRACVTSGTSRAAEVGGGILVYGKSGSAEKRGGQDHGATYGWFTCYAEREGKPAEIAVCAMLEPAQGQNYHGGEVAAPIARQVISAYYFGLKNPTVAAKPSGRRRR